MGAIAVVPACGEATRIAATVHTLQEIPDVDHVVVVDDGSSDETLAHAQLAGAIVIRHPHNSGKAASVVSGAEAAAALDQRDGCVHARPLLLVDADLRSSASSIEHLLRPVLDGHADMTMAVLRSAAPSRGRGRVVRLSRWAVARTTGRRFEQPLSGQRAIIREAFDAARPLAPRFGLEVGLTIDLMRQGYVLAEVPMKAEHRASGADMPGRLHRAGQLVDVVRAVLPRLVWRENPSPRLRLKRAHHALVSRLVAPLGC